MKEITNAEDNGSEFIHNRYVKIYAKFSFSWLVEVVTGTVGLPTGTNC